MVDNYRKYNRHAIPSLANINENKYKIVQFHLQDDYMFPVYCKVCNFRFMSKGHRISLLSESQYLIINIEDKRMSGYDSLGQYIVQGKRPQSKWDVFIWKVALQATKKKTITKIIKFTDSFFVVRMYT